MTGTLLLVALAVGQAEPPAPPAVPLLTAGGVDRSRPTASIPRPEDALQVMAASVAQPPRGISAPEAGQGQVTGREIGAPVLPLAPPAPPPPPGVPPPAVPAPDRWYVMRELQGTWVGAALDQNRLYVTGWIEQSFTASTDSVSNGTVVWNDRANRYLLQQAWTRIGRSVVTSGTTAPSWGFQIDVLTGTDYRFTLQRGLLNAQLANNTGAQNLYGVDPIQHYVNLYVPTLFAGTEFRAGRLYTPWGVESLEAVSTPLLSRSYAFNFSPPFTHSGVGAYITFNPVWSAVLMAANGNDVYFGDSSAEWRFVGNVKWTQPGGGRNTVTLATSLGSGWFNPSAPHPFATVALANEPFGRNNFNAFDVVWTHTFSPRLSYNFEGIYAYQANVPGASLPGNDPGGSFFTNWASGAHYLFATFTPRLGGILRFETFDDFQGQRTGFQGLYSALTGGIQIRPRKGLIIRPELRYDYNGQDRPFEGKHGIFTAAADVILRW